MATVSFRRAGRPADLVLRVRIVTARQRASCSTLLGRKMTPSGAVLAVTAFLVEGRPLERGHSRVRGVPPLGDHSHPALPDRNQAGLGAAAKSSADEPAAHRPRAHSRVCVGSETLRVFSLPHAAATGRTGCVLWRSPRGAWPPRHPEPQAVGRGRYSPRQPLRDHDRRSYELQRDCATTPNFLPR
jgi:hypothetical protein